MIIIPSSKKGIITPSRSLLAVGGGGLNIINRKFTDFFPIGPRSHMKARERWDVLDAATGRVVKSMRGAWQHNLILNCGKDMACTNFFINCLAYGHLGTGTAAPAVTDTHLAAPALSTSVHGAETSYTSISGDTITLTDSFVFPAQTGDFAFTEFSASVNSAASANMFNRIVFDDPIVGGAGQQPKVTIELAITLSPFTTPQVYTEDVIAGGTPVAGSTGSARIRSLKWNESLYCRISSRTTYNAINADGAALEPSWSDVYRCGCWVSTLGTLLPASVSDEDWDGASYTSLASCMSVAAYTTGSYRRSKTWTAGLTDLNLASIRSFGILHRRTEYMNLESCVFQFLCDTPFDKLNTQSFAINMDFAVDAN